MYYYCVALRIWMIGATFVARITSLTTISDAW